MFRVLGLTSTYCIFWIFSLLWFLVLSKPMISTSKGKVLPSVKESVTRKGILQSFLALFLIALILIALYPSVMVSSRWHTILGVLMVRFRSETRGFWVIPSIHTKSRHWIVIGYSELSEVDIFGTLVPIMNLNSPCLDTLNLNSSKYSKESLFLTPKTYYGSSFSLSS